MQKLKVSKYLRIVPRGVDFAVYHSLYGNLLLVDAEGKALLQAFGGGCFIDEAIRKFSAYDASVVWSYVHELRMRDFLVTDDADEYGLVHADALRREKQLEKGYLLRVLQLVVANTCNFNCTYCFVDKMYGSKERDALQHRPENMTMSFSTAKQSIEKALDIVVRNGIPQLNIEFFGGEPLMNWPLIKRVLETFRTESPKGIELLYSVTTNGSLITEEMARLFKEHNVTVTVSFDSPGSSAHPAVKAQKGGDPVKEKLEILKKYGNWVTFNAVISRETVDSYDGKALIDTAKQYHIAMVGLILDLDLSFYSKESRRKKVIEQLWATYEYGRDQGVAVVGYWYQIFNQIAGLQPINLLSGYKTCPATGCKVSVEPEGHVFICKCCSDYLGHVSQLEAVLKSERYRRYSMQAYRNAPGCDGCAIEGFCSGVCMGALEKKYQRIDIVESSSCEVYKGITRKLLQNVDSNDVEVRYLHQDKNTSRI